MNKLSTRSLDRSLDYLSNEARPLELARWRCFRHPSENESILDALRPFRNQDGGFGKALEPDMRATGSSVLATVEALDILQESKVRPDHSLVTGAIDWLMSPHGGFDTDTGLWPYVGRDIDKAAQAPWWNIDNLAETFDGFLINPRGRVLGHLLRSGYSHPIIETALVAVIDTAESAPDAASPDTLRSLISLYDAAKTEPGMSVDLPSGDYRQRLENCISRMIPASVVVDPTGWREYGLQPLEVAESPESPWLSLLSDAVETHLDYLIENQEEDGSWAPFWTWGDHYPADWIQAKREWSGVLTVKNLRRLASFGRI